MKIRDLLNEDLEKELSVAQQQGKNAQATIDDYLAKGGKRHAKSRVYNDSNATVLAAKAKAEAAKQAIKGKTVKPRLTDYLNNASIAGFNDKKVAQKLKWIFKGIDNAEELVQQGLEHWQKVKDKPESTHDIDYKSHGIGSDQSDQSMKKNMGQMSPKKMAALGMDVVDKQKRLGKGNQPFSGEIIDIDKPNNEITIDLTGYGKAKGYLSPFEIRVDGLDVGGEVQFKAKLVKLPTDDELGHFTDLRSVSEYKPGTTVNVSRGNKKTTTPDDAFNPNMKAPRRIK